MSKLLLDSDTTAVNTLVSANSDVTTNTAKETNATHTGDVTGAGALAVDKTAITGKGAVTALGTDYVIISDTSDTGNLKKALVSDFASAGGDMAAATYDPENVAGDAFLMSKMAEDTDAKILTATERTAIGTNTDKVSYTDAVAVGLNTAKDTNVSTNLSLGTKTSTTMDVNSSDGTNATLIEADTTNAGILGSDKFDEIVANTNKTGITAAQASAITANTSKISYNSTASTKLGTIEESADVTDAVNVVSSLSGATLSGALVAADHGTAATAQISNTLYGTGDPPTANTTPIGSVFYKYTA